MAKAPNNSGDDAPVPLDSETKEMIRLLQAAADRAKKLILNPLGKTDKSKAFNASRAAQLLAGVNRELDQVGAKMVNVTSKKIAGAFRQGVAEGDQLARDAGIRSDGSPLQGGFAVVDRRRAAILVKQTQQANEDLSKAIKSIKDTTGKIVRQTQAYGLDSAAINRMLAGGTIEGVPRSALRDLKKLVRTAAIDGKIVTVNTQTGVVMHFKPDYYAELVYQSKLAETTNIATVQRLREKKIFYVKIIGSNSRNFCTAFVGRAFYIGDGADPLGLYPNIRELPRGGAPFHPKCTKRYVAFVPALQSSEQIEAAKLKPNERELLGKNGTDAQRQFEAQRQAAAPPAPVDHAAAVQAEAKDARRKLREIDQGITETGRRLTARRQELSRQLTEALDKSDYERADELAGEAKKVIDQQAAAEAHRRAAGLAVLKAERPPRINSLLDGALGADRKAVAEQGIEAFSKLVDSSLLPSIDVVIRPPQAKYLHLGRSYYDEGIIYQAESAQPRTIVHEFGHLIEDASPGLHAATLAFYDRRTAGGALKSLRRLTGLDYDPREQTREDEFFDPYVGKDYNRRATEIISMGLESLHSDPFFLAREDPDFFEFLFKAMRGVFQ